MSIVRLTTFVLSLGCAYLLWAETPEDVLAYKRRIHEQVTGQRLDERGRPLNPVRLPVLSRVKTDAPRMLKANVASPLSVSVKSIAQRADSKWVDVSYSITGGSGTRCYVIAEFYDDNKSLYATTFTGDIGDGVTPGNNLKFSWNAGADWPDEYSQKVKVKLTAKETAVPLTYAKITISWADYHGRDLDICGYWLDRPSARLGWSWGPGEAKAPYYSSWGGDNTGSGPEVIQVGIDSNTYIGPITRKYRIHFNYYGEYGSPCKAKVTVSNNGKTLSKEKAASKRLGTQAKTSDPSLTITFDEYGTPISID